MLDGFAGASKIPTEVLIVLEWPASFSVKQLQTMFDMVISTFPEEQVQKKKKRRDLWKPIVNHVVESLDKEHRGAGTAGY